MSFTDRLTRLVQATHTSHLVGLEIDDSYEYVLLLEEIDEARVLQQPEPSRPPVY
jgi:hypothetical protein